LTITHSDRDRGYIKFFNLRIHDPKLVQTPHHQNHDVEEENEWFVAEKEQKNEGSEIGQKIQKK